MYAGLRSLTSTSFVKAHPAAFLRHLIMAVGWTLAIGLALPGTGLAAVQLITDASLKAQKDLTSEHKLKNGIPVIIRTIPDSDLLQVHVTFHSGLKDLKPGRKVLNQWLWEVLPMAGADYPKAKVFSLGEKYGLELGCTGGIEYSACSLGTLNDYWDQALPLFAALLTKPSFNEEDVALTKERLTAELADEPSDPGNYVNEVVNSIFYPPGHPYRLNHDEALAELSHLGKADLTKYHQEIANAGNLSIVVVTSLPAARIMDDLEKAFGQLGQGHNEHITPPAPAFDLATSYNFVSRELPTAYIRIKLNAPSIHDKDAMATRLLYEILSEELNEEIRTKRSLSYAVHAFLIQYSIGVGVLNASTSHPKETLEAIRTVLEHVEAKNYSDAELEEYKHGFATSFYLSQETHASLASSLANAYFFYGNAAEYYELPRRLDLVTPQDIKRLATTILKDFRIGAIYGRSNFEDSWAKDLIKQSLAPAQPAAAQP